MKVVEGSSLTKTFGSTRGISNLSFTMTADKITGLVGRNGAGKTTLLNIIAGYMLPSGGSIRVFSEDPFNNIKAAANMVFIHENMALPATLNLQETLDAAALFYANWNHRLAAGLLEYFNLPPRQYHVNLSKGMKSAFNMIIGIAACCPLTIFDEPTSGMDAAVRKDFYRALLKDYLRQPRTIIFSNHLLNEIKDILDDVLLLHKGEKYLHMPVADLDEYAIGFQGREETVVGTVGSGQIIYRKKFGKDGLYAVVLNKFNEKELEEARMGGLEISPVATEDLCVYLTARQGGGIDDVFDGN